MVKVFYMNNLVKEINPFKEVDKASEEMAEVIVSILKKEIDDKSFFKFDLIKGIEKSIKRMLVSCVKFPKMVDIFPDAIPGFTIMVFRLLKDVGDSDITSSETDVDSEGSGSLEYLRDMGNNFGKDDSSVYTIEYNGALFTLFSLNNTKDVLKSLGYLDGE